MPEASGLLDQSPPEGPEVPGVGSDLPAIGVRGDFIDRLIYIAASSVSLVNSVGYLDGEKPVLVPFADVRLLSDLEDGDTRHEAFSELMTLDNLASLLADLCTDFSAACAELGVVAQGSLTLEPTRLERIKAMVRRMNDQMGRCADDLDRFAPTDATS